MKKEFLYSVKAKGHEIQVKQVDGYSRKSRDEETHTDPIMLNDGTTIMYVWASSESDAKIFAKARGD